MKVKEILDKVNRLKINSVDDIDKLDWINDLDGLVHKDILLRAEDYTGEFAPYTVDDLEKTVLVTFPYEEIYIHYLSAKIDLINGEIASYNNNIALFNDMYEKFAAYYRRMHVPKGW